MNTKMKTKKKTKILVVDDDRNLLDLLVDTLEAVGYQSVPAPGGVEALHTVARFGTSTAVKEGIKAGLGVSVISSRALKTELKSGILKALRIRDLPMSRSFYLIRDKRRMPSPLCRTMLGFLVTDFKEGEG